MPITKTQDVIDELELLRTEIAALQAILGTEAEMLVIARECVEDD